MPPAAAITDATWRAIESRDARADGRFLYGVTSTGCSRPVSVAAAASRSGAGFAPLPMPRRPAFRACRDASGGQAAPSGPRAPSPTRGV